MKLHIKDKVYDWNGADDVPLIHRIRLQRETGIGPNELRAMYREQQAYQDRWLAEKEIAEKAGKDVPEAPAMDLILLGVSVWLARLTAGEKLSFEEACDVKPSEMQFVAEPGDPGFQEDVDPTRDAVKPTAASGKSKRRVEAVA